MEKEEERKEGVSERERDGRKDRIGMESCWRKK